MKNEIYQHFGLYPQELVTIGKYHGFWIRSKVYILLPVNRLQEEVLGEIKKLSDFMIQQGELAVATFVPTIQGYYVSEISGTQYMLARCNRQGARGKESEAASLALFHYRGKQFSETIEHLNQIGKWKGMWEKRLEQLEQFWQSKVLSQSKDEFDELFIETFPYYLGLTENAIQYLADTELDDEPQNFDGATICHQKYSSKYWKYYQRLRIPFDWVYDHPSRDLAEWIRSERLENKDGGNDSILAFLKEYEEKTPLSSFAWKLLYSRLLFPLHYFEAIEGYYSQQEPQQRKVYHTQLENILHLTEEYQNFLRDFYDIIQLPAGQLQIRKVEWL